MFLLIKVPILLVVISFWMKPWPVVHFFHSILESGNIQNFAACHFFTAVQEMTPDFKSEWKKMGNGQSFIRKEITTNRIGTLVDG